ncbi:hypothetical protein [Ohtaekwangia koreensis]|uniref:TraB family protein n=1 Tax=Ohtaekwangia koreensis TaxID=688867 RepID=A0A1T5M2C1_9BACT|nr:hypothetical protein [Ohtaekwangia koreensis]SKC82392.1 hypothetical protein SAMN05660236_4171 [Ohtaekwangia koreensis]
MKSAALLFILCCLFSNCQENKPAISLGDTHEMVDYLRVASMINELGGPTVLDLKNSKGQQVVLVGCPHSRDTTAKEFDLIDVYFKHLKPEVAFNEGGSIQESVHYVSRNEAILKGGETALLKYYCDQSGIKMLNGDFTEEEEFEAMLKRYPKDELLLYYSFERFIVPYKYGMDSDKPIEEAYADFTDGYLAKHKFPLTEEEKSFDYFKALYKKYMANEFDLGRADIEQFDFLNDNCKFCAVGRASKVVRDEVLLQKINAALDQYNRIFITFGGAHALAIEPALKNLLRKKAAE